MGIIQNTVLTVRKSAAGMWNEARTAIESICACSVSPIRRNLPTQRYFLGFRIDIVHSRAPLLDFNASEPLQTSVEAIQEGWQAISAGVLSNWLEHEVTPNGSGAAIVYNGLSIYLQYVLMDKVRSSTE